MLRGAALSEALRAISAPVLEFATFRGSVGPWPRAGDLGALSGWVGSCEVAVPGATGCVGVCSCETFEVLRECMGTFVVVGAGAGRV
jgi:hypothetical protein